MKQGLFTFFLQIYELYLERSRHVKNHTDATHHGFLTIHLDLIQLFLVSFAYKFCITLKPHEVQVNRHLAMYTIKDYNEQAQIVRNELDTMRDIASELADFFQSISDNAANLIDEVEDVDYE